MEGRKQERKRKGGERSDEAQSGGVGGFTAGIVLLWSKETEATSVCVYRMYICIFAKSENSTCIVNLHACVGMYVYCYVYTYMCLYNVVTTCITWDPHPHKYMYIISMYICASISCVCDRDIYIYVYMYIPICVREIFCVFQVRRKVLAHSRCLPATCLKLF